MISTSLFYGYKDNLKKFNETSFAEKEDFYIQLNMEDITDADYAKRKKVCKDFKIKTIRKISLFVCSIHYCQLIRLKTF